MIDIKKVNWIILLFSIIVGVFMGGQFKQNIPSLTPATLRSIDMTKNEIKAISREVEDLKEISADKQEQLKVLESLTDGEEDIIDVLTSELEKNKTVAGFQDVQGPGITFLMKDNMAEEAPGEEYNLDVIHDIDVLRIINDLRGAGAEAISLNGQRVLFMTEIKCGGPVIRVNGKSLAAPFVIKAIGDIKLLNAAVNAPDTYGYDLRVIDQLDISSTVEDNIVIMAYNGRFNFRNAKPIGEGD